MDLTDDEWTLARDQYQREQTTAGRLCPSISNFGDRQKRSSAAVHLGAMRCTWRCRKHRGVQATTAAL